MTISVAGAYFERALCHCLFAFGATHDCGPYHPPLPNPCDATQYFEWLCGAYHFSPLEKAVAKRFFSYGLGWAANKEPRLGTE